MIKGFAFLAGTCAPPKAERLAADDHGVLKCL